MLSACSAFVCSKVCCIMAGNKEVIYELNLPLKAIIFNHTEFDKETLTPRTGQAGEQLANCLRNDMQITNIDHKYNQTRLQVVNALIECNFSTMTLTKELPLKTEISFFSAQYRR